MLCSAANGSPHGVPLLWFGAAVLLGGPVYLCDHQNGRRQPFHTGSRPHSGRPTAWYTSHASSYKRVKGRSHTVGKRISMHRHNVNYLHLHLHLQTPCNQLAIAVLTHTDSAQTHHTTSIATNSPHVNTDVFVSALRVSSRCE